MALKQKVLVALAALVVVVAVFGLKVWHAQGICAEFQGRWDDGECHFDETPAAELIRR